MLRPDSRLYTWLSPLALLLFTTWAHAQSPTENIVRNFQVSEASVWHLISWESEWTDTSCRFILERSAEDMQFEEAATERVRLPRVIREEPRKGKGKGPAPGLPPLSMTYEVELDATQWPETFYRLVLKNGDRHTVVSDTISIRYEDQPFEPEIRSVRMDEEKQRIVIRASLDGGMPFEANQGGSGIGFSSYPADDGLSEIRIPLEDLKDWGEAHPIQILVVDMKGHSATLEVSGLSE